MTAQGADARLARWLGACLLLLPLAIFADALAPQRAFFYRDILSFWTPQAEGILRAARERSWPLWNPYFGFGAPMLADAGHQLAYPFTWLLVATTPDGYYKALAVAHAALGALGAFGLGRRHGLREWPAAFAAALWACSGPFLSTLAMNQHFVGAAWMPWVLLAFEDLLAAPGLRAALKLGLCAGLQLLAASPDMCAMTALAAGLRVLAPILGGPRAVAQPVRACGAAALSGLVALGLAAAQWLPSLMLVSGSGRAQMGAHERGYWALHPAAALDLLLPGLVAGAPLSQAARAAVFESREPFLPCLYVGVLAVPLAVLGAGSSRRAAAVAAVPAAVFLALAVGRSNPVRAALAQVPPFHLLRYPVKHLVPFALFLCLLCGFGLQALRERRQGRVPGGGAGLAALAVAVLSAVALFPLGGATQTAAGLSWWLGPLPEQRLAFEAQAGAALAWALLLSGAGFLLLLAGRLAPKAAPAAAAALAVLALGDSLRVARSVNPTAPAALVHHEPPALARVRAAQAELRLYAAPSPWTWLSQQLVRGPAGWEAEPRFSLGLTELLQPLRGAALGVRGSYDGDFTGLAPAATAELSGLLSRFRATPFALRLLQLGNVGYVVTLTPSAFPSLPETAPPLASVFLEPIHVLQVPDPRPPAYVVDRARVAPEPASYVQLADPGFDPAREVVLAPPAGASPGSPGFAGKVLGMARRMDEVTLQVELNGPGFVVLVEAYDAGWRAEVDSQPAPVLRANALFRAVALQAGRRDVRFSYRPPGAAIGLALSAATALAALGLALLARRRSPA